MDSTFDLEAQIPEINARLNKIDYHKNKAEEMRISAGKILKDAKDEVLRRKSAGESITWKNWVETNIERSYSDVNKCIRLLEAPDPQAALDEDRAKAREGMAEKRKRDKEAAEAEGSNLDPTQGLDGVDTPEEPDIVDEVTEIVDTSDQFEYRKIKVLYWVKNVATSDDLNDVIAYMAIDDIPENIESKVEVPEAPEPLSEENGVSELLDEGLNELLGDTTEFEQPSEELDAEFEKSLEEEDTKELTGDPIEDDNYERPGYTDEDNLDIPEFLKRG